MCGITGLFAHNQVGSLFLVRLQAATQALAHRGPDHQGTAHGDLFGLGHRRLSIIDVSAEANQPFADPTGRYLLVFNGEIYNYRELRQQLEQQGIHFRTTSDTEVLLQGLIHWGLDCLSKLHGFFAFGFYDKQEHRLIIARDRLGIKPLWLWEDEDKVLFSSELASLLSYNVPRELDRVSLQHYLQFNYVPEPHTMMQGVTKVRPGEALVVTKKQVERHRFYRAPAPTHASEQPGDFETACAQVREKLEASVVERLVSDVPLGCFLSGGIDSSIIAGLAKRHKDDLETFSIGFPDHKFFDETNYATLTAKHFGTHHTVFPLREDELFDRIGGVLDDLAEPFADPSCVPFSLLSEKARGRVKVALSGDGADELFAGYTKYAALLRSLEPGGKEKVVANLLPLWKALPASRSSGFGNKVRQLRRFGEGMKLSPAERYLAWSGVRGAKDATALLAEGFLVESQDDLRWRTHQLGEWLRPRADLQGMLRSDLDLVLAGNMLPKVDRMSMSHALEVRVPFLDHRVVEFAQGLPLSVKITKGMRKRILQEAFRDFLPPELYQRPKHGFDVPLLGGLRRGWRSQVEELFSDSYLEQQGVFDPRAMAQVRVRLLGSGLMDQTALWNLVVFQWWYKKWMS